MMISTYATRPEVLEVRRMASNNMAIELGEKNNPHTLTLIVSDAEWSTIVDDVARLREDHQK